jgi:hypothetical protein
LSLSLLSSGVMHLQLLHLVANSPALASSDLFFLFAVRKCKDELLAGLSKLQLPGR